MGRKSRGKRATSPREALYRPSGPGIVLIEEGERESRHFRNVGDPLDLAYERGQISEELHQAGNIYREAYEKRGRSGLDSTQMIDRSRSGESTPTPFCQMQVDAIRFIERVEACMSTRDARIVRYFCGEARQASESVMRATNCHPSNIKYRIIEALEELRDAIGSSKRMRAA